MPNKLKRRPVDADDAGTCKITNIFSLDVETGKIVRYSTRHFPVA